MTMTTYPVRVDGALDDRLNRWLWLVKWVLVIPHLFVLAFLWIAFAVLSFVAFFAILFTGRYPRSIFDFNVGVLRWTWRVQFYAYGALGTDKYPPFTLDDVPSYPAHLEVEYPQHLSRGLVLVKWWLLAIPHYIVLAFFIGGGAWFATQDNSWEWGSGLVGLLVLIAAVVLLFTGRYPRSIFDLVLGMDRWALRVAAYAGLMVDKYPPFRLDMGGDDPGTTRLEQRSLQPSPSAALPPPPSREPTLRMSAGRTITLVLGIVATLASVVGLAVGGGLAWLDLGMRDSAGYVTTDKVTLETSGYAVASEELTIHADGATLPRKLFGDARVRVLADDGAPVFVGIASSADVRAYLAGVAYTTVTSARPYSTTYDDHAGGAPSTPPTEVAIWRTQAAGSGEQTITWPVENGDWMLVVMTPDVAANFAVQADFGATAPALTGAWIAVLATSGGFLLLGTLAVVLAVVRRPEPGPSTLEPASTGRSNEREDIH
ncbi:MULTISPECIES: DUF4389 domain-containing protein [unclassified Kribbella]|uniref:DUF4389 domain-containing protein n=1 Tax=unclassified Kribbella TaxID=2644121 RepID=UPI0033FAFEE8